MGLEVANLKATIEFAAKGEAQAKQAAESVERAVESFGSTLDTVGEKATSYEARLRAASKELASIQAEHDAATRAILGGSEATSTASESTQKYAQAVATLNEQLGTARGAEASVVQEAIGHAQAALEASTALDKEAQSAQALLLMLQQLGDERRALQRQVRAGGEGGIAAVPRLAEVDQHIARGSSELLASAARADVLFKKMDSSGKKVGETLQQIGVKGGASRRNLGLLVRNISGLTSASRGGVAGMSMLATSLGRLGPYAVAAAAALALVWKTIKLMGETQAVSHIAPLSDSILAIGEASMRTENQMKPLVQQVRNVFSAQGFTNVEVLTEDILRLAAAFKNLTPSGTIEESIRIITTAIQGNVNELGKLSGVATGPYEAMLESMGPAATQAERLQAITEMLTQQQVKSADDIAAADARKQDSLERLSFAWKTLTDLIAEALAGPLGTFIIWITDVVNGLTVVIGKVEDFVSKFDGVVDVLERAYDAAKPLMLVLSPGTAALGWLASIGQEGREAAEGAKEAADAIDGATDATEKWNREISRQEQINQAQKKYKEYLDTVGQGQNAIGAVKNLGDALTDLEKAPNPQNILAAMTAFQTLFAVVQAGGLQALDAFQNFTESLGFGPKVDEMIAQMVGLTRDALEPVEEHMNKVGVEAGRVTGPVDAAASSFGAAGNVAQTAAGQVYGLEAALSSIAGDYTTRLNVVTSGSTVATGPFYGLGDPAANVPSPTPKAPLRIVRPGDTEVSARMRNVIGGITGGRRQETIQRRRDQLAGPSTKEAVEGPSRALAGMFGGGGGGGGGGAARDRNLAIEEIRAFIEQVNKAVMAGIRGGVVYSTAGNAIPLGGPGEFVKNEGGVNIGTINLRGVWDFADPAAKREIVRQLQEALAQYQKEVA